MLSNIQKYIHFNILKWMYFCIFDNIVFFMLYFYIEWIVLYDII